MLRTRQIIDPLVPRTDQLIKDRLLPPNIKTLLNSSKIVRYPPFVYELQKKHKWAFAHFGLFTEHLLRKMLQGDWKGDVYDLYISLTSQFTPINKLVKKEDLNSVMGRFVNISKYITSEFGGKEVLYDREYIHKVISGHPDMETEDGVYDVKTVTKFNTPTTKNQAILQISSYLALSRAMGRNPKWLGIILPFQHQTLKYNLEEVEYNHTPFLNLLLELARPRICTIAETLELQLYLPQIGAHTLKIGASVSKSLLNYYKNGNYNRPCQIFMRGNRGAKSVKLSDIDIAESLSLVMNHNIKYFVHASYTINLCHPCGNKTKDKNPVPWATNILREDLELCGVTGGRGVVVHTGKALHLTEEEGYDAMYQSCLSVLDAATEECPLLIETPCDKGTELCGTPQSLAEFYRKFTDDERTRIKVCVDTCHVFAAGYMPLDYLITFTSLVGESAIALIHLNDAQWVKGSGRDGHAGIGGGCIGMSEMLRVIKWCSSRGIPMVQE